MSVLRLVLRHAAVNAVSGFFSGVNSPTIAGNRVFDSKIEPVENIREDAAYPTVVIYTDYDRNAFPHSGISHQERTLTITFELLMAVMTKTPDDVGKYTVRFPVTDAELESSLDVLEFETFQALRRQNSAADCFRSIAYGLDNMVSRRGATVEGGTKIAARQVTYEARVIQELDHPIEHPAIKRFYDDLILSPGGSEFAEEVQRLFTEPGAMSPVDRLEATMGWTRATREALGYPLSGAPVSMPPTIWLNI